MGNKNGSTCQAFRFGSTFSLWTFGAFEEASKNVEISSQYTWTSERVLMKLKRSGGHLWRTNHGFANIYGWTGHLRFSYVLDVNWRSVSIALYPSKAARTRDPLPQGQGARLSHQPWESPKEKMGERNVGIDCLFVCLFLSLSSSEDHRMAYNIETQKSQYSNKQNQHIV